MKKLTAATFLVGGAILASQSVFGQAVGNDLYFGFQNQAGGGTEDYIINLGAASAITGQSSTVDLSSAFSLSDFNAVLGGSSSLFGGVIGAASTATSGIANTADVYLTQFRSGGAGLASMPGSSVSQQLSRNQDNTTYADLGTLYSPAAGTGGLDSGKTWDSLVDPTTATGTFQSNTGLNPDSAVSPSGVLYEDLWTSSSSTLTGTKGFTYLGYFTLDLAGSSPSLTFTGVNAVPEPTVLALLGGAGLLFLSLRRRLNDKNA